MGIEFKELKSTNDYWARDYMPIQLGDLFNWAKMSS